MIKKLNAQTSIFSCITLAKRTDMDFCDIWVLWFSPTLQIFLRFSLGLTPASSPMNQWIWQLALTVFTCFVWETTNVFSIGRYVEYNVKASLDLCLDRKNEGNTTGKCFIFSTNLFFFFLFFHLKEIIGSKRCSSDIISIWITVHFNFGRIKLT